MKLFPKVICMAHIIIFMDMVTVFSVRQGFLNKVIFCCIKNYLENGRLREFLIAKTDLWYRCMYRQLPPFLFQRPLSSASKLFYATWLC